MYAIVYILAEQSLWLIAADKKCNFKVQCAMFTIYTVTDTNWDTVREHSRDQFDDIYFY